MNSQEANKRLHIPIGGSHYCLEAQARFRDAVEGGDYREASRILKDFPVPARSEEQELCERAAVLVAAYQYLTERMLAGACNHLKKGLDTLFGASTQ
jgi:hypothetical protein